ncbi:MBOAT-like protein 1 [Elsinoe fawcettii]|nr:MBOAT-like protein 1 [Elsinoe fawcettii]
MNRPLNLFKAIYSLDTLDSRLTTSSTAPPRSREEQDKIVTAKRDPGSPLPDAQPSKWKTPEFISYVIIVAMAVMLMLKAMYEASNPGSPDWDKIQKHLSPGWILGRQVDNSDSQYSMFRDHIPYMTALLIAQPLLRRLYGAFWRIDSYTQVRPESSNGPGLSHGLSTSAAADARLHHRVSFDFGFAMVFIGALHGVSALKVLLILYTNYKLAKELPRSYVPAATWIFNIGILFANELGHGYPLAEMLARISPPSDPSSPSPLAAWAASIDNYGGLVKRWEILFNLTVLRLISFNLDYYWASGRGDSSPIEKKQLNPTLLSERDRVTYGATLPDFSFRTYLSYALYAPLYLTGPILTFNDYISQSRHPLPTISPLRTFLYGIRFLLVLLCMELVLHYLYAVALSHSSPSWAKYTPMQLAMVGYFNLHIIWLKLLIPWRFARLWALLDGIDPPENMVRCMSDNYSTLAFWRGWHRSFNRWIVRYIYIPLGGSGQGKVRGIANFLVVFTFVAVWHDINLRLLMWGWLITLFVLPEVVAGILVPKRKFKGREDVYRWLSGVGAVGNVLMMMAGNSVGFALGLDGTVELAKGIVGDVGGMMFFVAACSVLFVGVQVMFEHREAEKRRGVKLAC